MLPEEVRRLPEELARVDALLDDPAFFTPFVRFFDLRMGRPSTPMEVYLRSMFLKFRYRLGYESLCREASDSITWRRFCRIPLDGAVPHPTTLMKLTTRCGSVAVDGLNETLLAKAAEAKPLRTNRIRVDTTVVCANVAYPTDSSRWPRRCGGSARPASGSRPPAVRRAPRFGTARVRRVNARMRSGRNCGCGRRPAADQARPPWSRASPVNWPSLAATAADEAQRLLVNAKRALRRARATAAELRNAASMMRRRGGAGAGWPRGQRADRTARRDPPDRRAYPPTGRRDHPGRGESAG